MIQQRIEMQEKLNKKHEELAEKMAKRENERKQALVLMKENTRKVSKPRLYMEAQKKFEEQNELIERERT